MITTEKTPEFDKWIESSRVKETKYRVKKFVAWKQGTGLAVKKPALHQ